MPRYQVTVDVGTKANGKPDFRRLNVTACNDREAEELAASKVAQYGPQAQIISVYLV